jgi:hypothetical protein
MMSKKSDEIQNLKNRDRAYKDRYFCIILKSKTS